jgi:hypothetical protein
LGQAFSGGAKSVSYRNPDGNRAELINPGFWAIS